MTIFGIGIDLIKVKRIQQALEKYGDRFKNRIFTPTEQNFCESQKNKYLSYAARFAAKEAFSKALGTGLRGIISWQEIGVLDDEKSPPRFIIKGKAQQILNNRRVLLSITHTNEYACAIVIIEE